MYWVPELRLIEDIRYCRQNLLLCLTHNDSEQPRLVQLSHLNFDQRYTQKKNATAKRITCKRCPFVLTLRLLSNLLPIVFSIAFALATVSSCSESQKSTMRIGDESISEKGMQMETRLEGQHKVGQMRGRQLTSPTQGIQQSKKHSCTKPGSIPNPYQVVYKSILRFRFFLDQARDLA